MLVKCYHNNVFSQLTEFLVGNHTTFLFQLPKQLCLLMYLTCCSSSLICFSIYTPQLIYCLLFVAYIIYTFLFVCSFIHLSCGPMQCFINLRHVSILGAEQPIPGAVFQFFWVLLFSFAPLDAMLLFLWFEYWMIKIDPCYQSSPIVSLLNR